MNQSSLELSLIIPAYNEQQLIHETLETLVQFLDEIYTSFEVLVIDDGSLDQTAQVVRNFMKDHPVVHLLEQKENMGKGCAIQRGVTVSQGKFIIFMDADLPYELDALPDFVDALQGGSDLVIGSRHMQGSLVRDVPAIRYFIGQVFSVLVSLMIIPGIRDTQCGFKGFASQAAREIYKRTTIDRFGVDVEVLFIARKMNYSIKQVPVRMTGFRSDSRVKVIKDSIRMFLDLFRIRLNDMRGIYN